MHVVSLALTCDTCWFQRTTTELCATMGTENPKGVVMHHHAFNHCFPNLPCGIPLDPQLPTPIGTKRKANPSQCIKEESKQRVHPVTPRGRNGEPRA